MMRTGQPRSSSAAAAIAVFLRASLDSIVDHCRAFGEFAASRCERFRYHEISLTYEFLPVLIACMCLACPASSAAAQPVLAAGETSQGLEWSPDAQMKIKSIADVQPSPDGRRVIFTATRAVMTGETSEMRTHVYLASTDGSGASQLTQGDKSCRAPQWSPDGEWIAFTSNRTGKNNVWLIRAKDGEAEQLTEAKSDIGSYRWSPDGKWIAFVMPDPPSAAEEQARKEKNDARVVDGDPKMNRLWLVPVERPPNGKRELRALTGNEFNVTGGFSANSFDWSPDSKRIVFSHTPTPLLNDWTMGDISIVDVASLEVKPLVHTGAAEFSPLFSADGRWIAFTASDDPPKWAFSSRILVIPAVGGKARPLAETFDQRPELLGWSADSNFVYITEMRGTLRRLSALPLDARAPIDIDSGRFLIGPVRFNPSLTMAGFSGQDTDRPPEAYVTRLDNYLPIQVSHVNADIPQYPLGETQILHWASADGLKIEGMLTYPVGYQAGKQYPLLLEIHGGPTGQFSRSFIANPTGYPTATFAARGFAVLRCNVRGSSGYGRTFRFANYKDWGGNDLRDLMAGIDLVIAMGVADPERLGVMGWSYGGFMTSWIITQTKKFKAASVGAGPTDLVSFVGTADVPGFVPDYMGVEFWDDLDIYRAHSPIYNIKGVTTPTLIQHGEADKRVPISQSFQLYEALKRQGVATEMVTYPRQGHGIEEPRLLVDVAKRNVEWFVHYLHPRPSVSFYREPAGADSIVRSFERDSA